MLPYSKQLRPDETFVDPTVGPKSSLLILVINLIKGNHLQRSKRNSTGVMGKGGGDMRLTLLSAPTPSSEEVELDATLGA